LIHGYIVTNGRIKLMSIFDKRRGVCVNLPLLEARPKKKGVALGAKAGLWGLWVASGVMGGL
jgi:hypothetical protein